MNLQGLFFSLLTAFLMLFTACGDETKQVEFINAPAGCEPIQVEEGLVFTCTDKDGNTKSGLLKHGKNGLDGKQGDTGLAGKDGKQGDKGEKGDSLTVITSHKCAGSVEGWIKDSSYQIETNIFEFETGHKFISHKTSLKRSDEILNYFDASPSFMPGEKEVVWSDRIFDFEFKEDHLLVKKKTDEEPFKIECVEVK